jgi:hypothetical protein
VRPFEVSSCADLGDVALNPTDLMATMTRVTKFYEQVKAAVVRPLTAGRDHLTDFRCGKFVECFCLEADIDGFSQDAQKATRLRRDDRQVGAIRKRRPEYCGHDRNRCKFSFL